MTTLRDLAPLSSNNINDATDLLLLPDGHDDAIFAIDEHLDAVAKAALKRKRHRDVVARSRMRQKATIATLRTQEAALCKQLTRLLSGRERQRKLVEGAQESVMALAPRTEEPYALQVVVQESIRRENEQLQDRIDELARFQRTVESELSRAALASRAHVAEKETVTCDSSDGRGYWVYFSGDKEPIYYEPLTVQSCEASMQTVFRRMLALYEDFLLKRIAVHETQCFGWKVQRPLRVATASERRLLRFQLTKTIRCVEDTMDDIVNRTWVAFHDPVLFAKIYSTVVVTRVVQRVNDHMTVLIQNAPNPDGLTNIRYFNILAKMAGFNEKRERVVALVKTIVNPTKISMNADDSGGPRDASGSGPPTQPSDVEWMQQGFSFLLLTEAARRDPQTGSRFIHMHYGTHYECINEAHARYLMLEVLGLAQRWEQMVLPTHHLTF